MTKNLHELPKFSDRWSHLYLEHGKLEKDKSGLVFYKVEGKLQLPIDQIGYLMLGPGTTVSHAAIKLLAENNTLLCWTGEQSVRLYAHSTGGTHHSTRLLRQAQLFSDADMRMAVIRRMYEKRFDDSALESDSLETIRGKEGCRVREAYQRIADECGVTWRGRNYDQKKWDNSDPLNRALSTANACLYGICHAAILSAGYSAAIGFIHTGKMLSFVYDVADLYKVEITIPVAFRAVSEGTNELEREVRLKCRDIFFRSKLMKRILPDIAEALNAGDDLTERPGEFEGQIITLADRAKPGSLSWQSERQDSRHPVGKSKNEYS